MSDTTKYVSGVIWCDSGVTVAGAILLPEFVPHNVVASLFSEIWGAGFFYLVPQMNSTARVEAYGSSTSLKVPSRGDADAAMIAKTLKLTGD